MYKRQKKIFTTRPLTESEKANLEEKVTLETETPEEILANLKADQKKYLIRVAFLILVNTILFALLIKGSSSVLENFLSALNANLIGLNLLGLILGTLVALIPYKGLNYKKKYFRASFVAILAIQVTLSTCLMMIGALTLFGWY